MSTQIRTVKEHLVRAKTQTGKEDAPKALAAVIEALLLLEDTQIFGRDKAEVELLLGEVLRQASGLAEIKALQPAGLVHKKGQEKVLLGQVRQTLRSLLAIREREELLRNRSYKNAIDQAVLGAQRLLDAGDQIEARKMFRRAAEEFSGEPGLLQDIGSRLLKAGLTQESLEYLLKAVDSAPRDPRPYGYLVMAYDKLGDLHSAEEAVMTALRNFGPSERIYLRIARLRMSAQRWKDAHEAAQTALEYNPGSGEARKIMAEMAAKLAR